MLLSLVLLTLTCSFVLPLASNDSEESAYRNKVHYPGVKYMKELLSTFADQSGRPRKNGTLTSYPTSVFCLPDFGEQG